MKRCDYFKRVFSFILCVLIAFFSTSCSKKGSSETETQGTTVQEITTVQLSDKIKANGFMPEMMPAGFPDKLPAAITCKTQSRFFADEETYGYKTDFIRLRLAGDFSAFNELNILLRGKGWTGGCEEYSEEEQTGEENNGQNRWIQGYWSNREYICAFSECDYDSEKLIYTVSLDVYENIFEFPPEVAKHFPAFNAPSLGQCKISVYKNNGTEVTDYGNIDSYKWICNCNENAFFVGVDFNMFDEYVTELADAGFILSEKEGSNEHGGFCTIEAKKVSGGKTYYAYLTYVDYLKTVSGAYMNDLDFFNNNNL